MIGSQGRSQQRRLVSCLQLPGFQPPAAAYAASKNGHQYAKQNQDSCQSLTDQNIDKQVVERVQRDFLIQNIAVRQVLRA